MIDDICVDVSIFVIGKATEPIVTPMTNIIIAAPTDARTVDRLLLLIAHITNTQLSQ